MIVSHDVPETLSIADYIYVIAQGKVISHGKTLDMKNSASAWVQQFMRGLPDGPVPFHYPAADYANELMGD